MRGNPDGSLSSPGAARAAALFSVYRWALLTTDSPRDAGSVLGQSLGRGTPANPAMLVGCKGGIDAAVSLHWFSRAWWISCCLPGAGPAGSSGLGSANDAAGGSGTSRSRCAAAAAPRWSMREGTAAAGAVSGLCPACARPSPTRVRSSWRSSDSSTRDGAGSPGPLPCCSRSACWSRGSRAHGRWLCPCTLSASGSGGSTRLSSSRAS